MHKAEWLDGVVHLDSIQVGPQRPAITLDGSSQQVRVAQLLLLFVRPQGQQATFPLVTLLTCLAHIFVFL